MESGEFFDISEDLNNIHDDLSDVNNTSAELIQNQKEIDSEISDLKEKVMAIVAKANITLTVDTNDSDLDFYFDTDKFNLDFDELYNEVYREIRKSVLRLPKLSKQDLLVSVGIGLIVALFDFFLVGTPHKGHSKKTGSPMTDLLRKIGNTKDGKLHPVLKWLEKKCQVPYDVSIVAGEGVLPYNHRLKSLGHDPVLGLIFGILDIINGTFTYIDNNGVLKIIKRTEGSENILMALVYFLGHLISDICTSAGIPIPGWCISQFFTDEGESGISIATLFEEMYREGYDLRHLASMTSSVKLGEFLLWLYYTLQYGKFTADMSKPIYEREIAELNYNLKKDKMAFIINATATSGNLAKFLLPPSNGNPLSLNLPQWGAMLESTITIIKDLFRDRTIELIVQNRKNIDDVWESLLEDN